MFKIVPVLGLLIHFAATAAVADGPGQTRTLSLTGTGQISAVPDMASVSVGVTTFAKTAKEALSENSNQMNVVFEVLQNSGIAPKDMQTNGLSLNPRWNNRSSGTKQPGIDGFEAFNTLRVTVRNVGDLGTVLDDITQAGANNIQSVQFLLKNPKPVQDRARQAAVADAKDRADLYSSAADVDLGQILSIREGTGAEPGPQYARMEAMAASPVPIAAGEMQVSASVTIVWQIE